MTDQNTNNIEPKVKEAARAGRVEPIARSRVTVAKPELLEAYMPLELIGGSLPYVPGTEEEAVWNAAAHALGTDRVVFVYTVYDGRCWYLAIPSSALASKPNSWCPLAAALPGNSEYWDRETVYLYEQDGIAAALRWEQETGRMQVFTGASRTILPRVQSMDANFISINAEKAVVVPWLSRSMSEENLSRFVAKMLILSGIAVAICSFVYWSLSHIMVVVREPDLTHVQKQMKTETNKLISESSRIMKSGSRKHMTNIQMLLEELRDVGGTLVRYEVLDKNAGTEWEALVPKSVDGSKIGTLKATSEGIAPDGRMRVKGRL